MGNSVQQDKIDILKNLLREMFQLNRGDLDFGLYRIMNLKAAEIQEFLDEQLLPQVKTVLANDAAEKLESLEQEREEELRKAYSRGIRNKSTDELEKLDRQIVEARKDAAVETDVYNHLGNFFARYYSEGDFMSQRRYSSSGKSSYLVPYDGEDIKLHWANADQYYIKTAENHASYIFIVGEGDAKRRVRLETTKADNEKDNIKAANGNQRRFVLAADGKGENKPAVEQDGDDIVIRFEHRPLKDAEKKEWPGNGNGQQGKINDVSHERIQAKLAAQCPALFAPAPTDADPERTVLGKHLATYTAKNTFDYFIHKDLGKFLESELDLYLNTEVLNLDDITLGDEVRLNRALLRARAVRHVAKKIIAFLAQLENFQKQLYLKKKFVLDTQYCVTLDRVPEALYEEIAKNEAQREEWARLLAVDEDPLTPKFLKANPYLVLDTRHFGRDFTDKLLSALSDAGPLDEQMDGLLIHGENFQALNFLQQRYAQQVKCVYIDPPYNTDASAILYKNDYKHSSWLSMMEGRLQLMPEFMTDDGILCVAIDDEEQSFLRIFLSSVFEKELGVVPVRSNPAGRKSTEQFSPSHEFALFFGMEKSTPDTLPKTEKEMQRYPFEDEKGSYAWNNLIRHGSGDKREDVPTMYYPIYVNKNDMIRVPKLEWDEVNRKYLILEEPKDDETAVYPIRNSIEKRWHRGWERISSEADEYRIRRDKSGQISIDFKIRIDNQSMPKTWWDDSKYASANHGARKLKELFGASEFDFPKSVELIEDCICASGGKEGAVILDYFAGSGTTGHAVINLNREDDGRRKYILAEMGEHFEDVLLPRLKKVVYSKDWKEGKPVSREGVTQFFKYVRLESYEDTLDGLELTPRTDSQQKMLVESSATAEDYQLRYALGAETADSAALLGKDFTDPWVYKLSVVRDGEREDADADLPETFNYLIGLRVERRKVVDDVLVIVGTDAGGRRCLVLWRDATKTDNDKLDEWFKSNHKEYGEIDLVYVNGDHSINAVAPEDKTWAIKPIEPTLRKLMFGGDD